MSDLNTIAQALVDELNTELGQKQESTVLLRGAIQGVQLLYTRLTEAEHERAAGTAEDSKSSGGKSKKTAKK